MKKLLLIAAVILGGATAANAQYKPEGSSFSTELNYSPGGASDGCFVLPEYGVKFRYFFNEDMAFRLSLGLNSDAEKVTTYVNDRDNNEYKSNKKTTVTTFSLMPGFEYHFNKYERISPYVGGEIGVLAGTTKVKTDNTLNDDNSLSKAPMVGFGINVVTGVDVYLCKGLYLGAELGLGYNSLDTKRGTVKTVTGSTTTEVDGNTSDMVSSFGFHATPSLRVGWHF